MLFLRHLFAYASTNAGAREFGEGIHFIALYSRFNIFNFFKLCAGVLLQLGLKDKTIHHKNKHSV